MMSILCISFLFVAERITDNFEDFIKIRIFSIPVPSLHYGAPIREGLFSRYASENPSGHLRSETVLNFLP